MSDTERQKALIVLKDVLGDLGIAQAMSHEAFCDEVYWKDEFEKLYNKAHSIIDDLMIARATQQVDEGKIEEQINAVLNGAKYKDNCGWLIMSIIRPYLRPQVSEEDVLRAMKADVEAIRNVAGDIELGYIGERVRSNIGGIVSRACDRLDADIAALGKQDSSPALAKAKEALEKLASLGAEPEYGNSTGNLIAQEALAAIKQMEE